MKINKNLLSQAALRGIISEKAADDLWNFFKDYQKDTPHFNATHILYYLGGLVAIAAMTLFMNLGWERFGGFGILAISLIYALIGILLTQFLFSKKLFIPGGITAAFVVALTPLAIYGFQKGMHWWPENYPYWQYHRLVSGLWIMMELGTLIVGAIFLYFYKRPFLVLPVAVTLWYLSLDLVPFFYPDAFFWLSYRRWITLVVGLIMILLALFIDIRSQDPRKDYAFHLYLFGVLAFWCALTILPSESEFNKFLYCLINLALVAVGAILSRIVFVVFGGLGIIYYLGYLAHYFFKDSAIFPVILTLIGFLVIYLGILWNKYGNSIGTKLRSYMPLPIQTLLEKRQGNL